MDINPQCIEAQKKIQLLHGREIVENGECIQIFDVDPNISTDEIFERVRTKFQIQDKQELVRSFRETPLPRTTKYCRKISQEEKKKFQVKNIGKKGNKDKKVNQKNNYSTRESVLQTESDSESTPTPVRTPPEGEQLPRECSQKND